MTEDGGRVEVVAMDDGEEDDEEEASSWDRAKRSTLALRYDALESTATGGLSHDLSASSPASGRPAVVSVSMADSDEEEDVATPRGTSTTRSTRGSLASRYEALDASARLPRGVASAASAVLGRPSRVSLHRQPTDMSLISSEGDDFAVQGRPSLHRLPTDMSIVSMEGEEDQGARRASVVSFASPEGEEGPAAPRATIRVPTDMTILADSEASDSRRPTALPRLSFGAPSARSSVRTSIASSIAEEDGDLLGDLLGDGGNSTPGAWSAPSDASPAPRSSQGLRPRNSIQAIRARPRRLTTAQIQHAAKLSYDFDSVFDGLWQAKCRRLHVIAATECTGVDTGEACAFKEMRPNSSCSLDVSGQKFEGRISTCGLAIKWSDGDVWIRTEPEGTPSRAARRSGLTRRVVRGPKVTADAFHGRWMNAQGTTHIVEEGICYAKDASGLCSLTILSFEVNTADGRCTMERPIDVSDAYDVNTFGENQHCLRCVGRLAPDGQAILWQDGDVWYRAAKEVRERRATVRFSLGGGGGGSAASHSRGATANESDDLAEASWDGGWINEFGNLHLITSKSCHSESGASCSFRARTKRRCVLMHGGKRHQGSLAANGSAIEWNDGDIWLRAEDSSGFCESPEDAAIFRELRATALESFGAELNQDLPFLGSWTAGDGNDHEFPGGGRCEGPGERSCAFRALDGSRCELDHRGAMHRGSLSDGGQSIVWTDGDLWSWASSDRRSSFSVPGSISAVLQTSCLRAGCLDASSEGFPVRPAHAMFVGSRVRCVTTGRAGRVTQLRSDDRPCSVAFYDPQVQPRSEWCDAADFEVTNEVFYAAADRLGFDGDARVMFSYDEAAHR